MNTNISMDNLPKYIYCSIVGRIVLWVLGTRCFVYEHDFNYVYSNYCLFSVLFIRFCISLSVVYIRKRWHLAILVIIPLFILASLRTANTRYGSLKSVKKSAQKRHKESRIHCLLTRNFEMSKVKVVALSLDYSRKFSLHFLTNLR